MPSPWRTTAASAAGCQMRPPDAVREPGRAGRHPDGPRAQQQPVGEAAAAEHAGDEERLGGRGHREQRERGDGAAEGDPEVALTPEEGEPVAGAHPVVGVRGGLRPAASAQQQRRGGHDDERQRVQREGEPEQTGRAERAADERAGGEAERAGGFHQAVGPRGVGVRPGCRGDERELGRLADRDAEAEHGHQRQQRPETVQAGEHRDHGRCLDERDGDQDPAVLEAVDDRACHARGQDDRPPEREDQRRDGERRAGALLHVQDQREDRHEVAERGEPGRPGEEAKVAAAWNRHGADRRERPFGHRSARVNGARAACAGAVRCSTVDPMLDVRLAGGLAVARGRRADRACPRRGGRARCSPISR